MRCPSPAKSRKLPSRIKEYRRQCRHAQQATVDANRSRIVARIEELARSFAPSKEQVFSGINTAKGVHVWETSLCFGRGKEFDDIGRWYRFCTALHHRGLHCQKAAFVTARLSEAQRFELKKLWALHDSLKNRVGRTRKYRYGRNSSPPAELMTSVTSDTKFHGLRVPTCKHQQWEPSFSTGEGNGTSPLEVSNESHLIRASERTGTTLSDIAFAKPFQASRNLGPRIRSSPSSSDDEAPPTHVALQELVAIARHRCKSGVPARHPVEVIEISSESEVEFVGKIKTNLRGSKGVKMGKMKNRRSRLALNKVFDESRLNIIEISSDSDEDHVDSRAAISARV